MKVFSVDESGYTGYELLNSDQPFQGASAVAISDADAADVIKKHFPNLQASELKYSSLTRRKSYRAPLIALQKDVLENFECVTCVANKRFLLILMFLDYATEPLYQKHGIHFYEGGQNYALASLLYYTAPTLLGEERFDRILEAFQMAVKVKSRDAIDKLVYRVRRSNWRVLEEALGPIANDSRACREAIATLGVTTDATLIFLTALINRMEEMSAVPYRVQHDRSTNALRYTPFLQQFIDHKEPIEFQQTKIARVKFPLKLAEVTQVDSKESPAVQVADILVGSAIEVSKVLTKHKDADLDPESIVGLYRDDQFIHYVPSLDFAEQKEFRAGSQSAEMIDYFTKNFRV